MARELQGELFEDLKDKDPQLKQFAKNIFPKRVPGSVQVSVDALILTAIFLVLGLIVAFALGFETGKKKTQAAYEITLRNFKKRENSNKPAPARRTDTRKQAVTSVPYTGNNRISKK